MEIWYLPRRLQAWYANADFKKQFTTLDLQKLRDGITQVTPESYPTVTDDLVGNLAYTSMYCTDVTMRDLAEQTLVGYIAWKRAIGAPVFDRRRLGVGMMVLGVATVGGVLVYRSQRSADA